GTAGTRATSRDQRVNVAEQLARQLAEHLLARLRDQQRQPRRRRAIAVTPPASGRERSCRLLDRRAVGAYAAAPPALPPPPPRDRARRGQGGPGRKRRARA